MRNKKILFITTAFYPQNKISVLRVGQWVKYWSHMDCEVTVLTTRKYSFMGPFGLETDFNPNVKVMEIDYLPSYLASKLENKNSVRVDGQSNNGDFDSFFKKTLRKARKYIGSLFDIHDLWITGAFNEGVKLLEANTYDFIISSYSPPAVHVVASKLKRKFPNVKWIADFRDLWAYNHLQSARGLLGLYEKYKERSTIKNSDIILTVSTPLSEVMQKKYPGIPVNTIENGFDEDEFPNWVQKVSEFRNRNSDQLIITYTGTIYEGKRDPTPLFQACNELIEIGLLNKEKIKINFYGNNVETLTKIINKNNLNKHSIINLKGFVSRNDSLKAQFESSLLLFLEWNDSTASGVLTGKLFEYLVSGVPIIAVGIDNKTTAGELIELAGVGKTAITSEAIKKILLDFIQSGAFSFYQPNVELIKEYSREKQAKKIIEIVNGD